MSNLFGIAEVETGISPKTSRYVSPLTHLANKDFLRETQFQKCYCTVYVLGLIKPALVRIYNTFQDIAVILKN